MDKENVAHLYNGILFSLKKRKSCHRLQHGCSLGTLCLLDEISQSQEYKYCKDSSSSEGSKAVRLIEAEGRMVVARGWSGEWGGKWGVAIP